MKQLKEKILAEFEIMFEGKDNIAIAKELTEPFIKDIKSFLISAIDQVTAEAKEETIKEIEKNSSDDEGCRHIPQYYWKKLKITHSLKEKKI